MSDLAPLVTFQDEARNRQSPEVFAGGLEFDFRRQGDFPDRHFGLLPEQFEDLDPAVVRKPLD